MLAARGNLDVADALQCHAKAHGVDVRADAATAFEQGDALGNVLALSKPLDAPEIKADLDRGADHGLALALEFYLVGLFQRDVVRPDGNAIAHSLSPVLHSRTPVRSVSRSISGGVSARPS